MKNEIFFRLRKSRLLSRVWNQALSYLVFRQWIVLVASCIREERPFWSNFTPIFPPPDRIWADPFVWVYKNNYYIFVEELLYETNRGRIACLALDKQLKLKANYVVLERPYHLSYPFLFKYDNQLYMLPETKGNSTIELYRCSDFPSKWKHVETLLSDINAVDSTILHANGKWWLFTCKADAKKSGSEALYLYFADQPISNEWISHPQNPIVRDMKFARPAGQIFVKDGNLIRPCQDCSVRYGYAMNFCRITSLTESDYGEIHEWTIKPPARTNILAAHTLNQAEGLYVTDVLLYRWKSQNDKQAIERHSSSIERL